MVPVGRWDLRGFEGNALMRSWKQLHVEDGVLVKEIYDEELGTPKTVPIIGKELRQKVLEQFHNTTVGGHFGAEKVFERCKKECYWAGLYSDAVRHCERCTKCQQVKQKTMKPPLRSIPVGKPWSLVGVDVLEVPRSKQGNKYLIVYQDYFSKWPEVYVAKEQTAEVIEKTLMDLISRFGPPDRLQSDQGANFESKLLSDSLQFFGIKKSHTTTYHPQGNGLVERMNRSILNLLRSFVEDSHDWESILGPILYAYRTATHSSTGFSPYEIMFARDPPAMIKQQTTEWGYNVNDWNDITRTRYHQIFERVLENISKAQEKQKYQYDRTARNEHFNSGEEVWVRSIRRTDKLSPIWQRGWFVKKVLSEQTVVIFNLEKGERVVNTEKIKKLIEQDDTQIDEPVRVRMEIDLDANSEETMDNERDEFLPVQESGQSRMNQEVADEEESMNEREARPQRIVEPPRGTAPLRPRREIQQPRRFQDEKF
jgi:hypothetical protein